MSATLTRPSSRPPSAAERDADRPQPGAPGSAESPHEPLLLAATAGLLVAAVLPLTRVFLGLGFLRPVLGAALLAVGLSAGCRRLGAGPLGTLVANVLGWLAFGAMAFLGHTLVFGVIPTLDTLRAGRELWLRGLELLQVAPAPTHADAALLLLTVTGVWAIAHAAEGLVFRLGAPVKAIALVLVLWTVPLVLAPARASTWIWPLPLLAAAAVLLLLAAGADTGRWGAWRDPAGARAHPPRVPGSGLVTAGVAILAGALLAGLLPGFGEPPWYEVRGAGGATLTRNPIVTIRAQLVGQSTAPLLRVHTEQPVYLRVTALDHYSDAEEWTIGDGIRGVPVSGRSVPPEVPVAFPREVEVDVRVAGLADAILVPVPYQPVAFGGPASRAFQYDRRNATVTLDRGTSLERGDEYRVTATVPAPPPEIIAAATPPPQAAVRQYTRLPGNVPQQVTDVARDIVAAAGATTPFEQAMAVQEELRTWEYSLDPPQGHSGSAMVRFIESRVGYCEQYAGTMAVMLRSLGIPARVAVGFTPGRLVDPLTSEYVVSQTNAHAWVEVLFDGIGWVAFEPTPRDDGNVLVPSAVNLAPAAMVAGSGARDIPPLPDRIPDDAPFLTPLDPRATPGQLVPDGGATSEEGRRGGRLALLALAAIAGVGGMLLAARGRGRTRHDPASRILAARSRVDRLGRGAGRPPSPAETDREYLTRLAPGTPAGRGLTEALERVRYSPRLDPGEAHSFAADAEAGAAAVTEHVLAGRRAWSRALIQVRGPLAEAGDRLGRAAAGALQRRTEEQDPSGSRVATLIRRRGGR